MPATNAAGIFQRMVDEKFDKMFTGSFTEMKNQWGTTPDEILQMLTEGGLKAGMPLHAAAVKALDRLRAKPPVTTPPATK